MPCKISSFIAAALGVAILGATYLSFSASASLRADFVPKLQSLSQIRWELTKALLALGAGEPTGRARAEQHLGAGVWYARRLLDRRETIANRVDPRHGEWLGDADQVFATLTRLQAGISAQTPPSANMVPHVPGASLEMQFERAYALSDTLEGNMRKTFERKLERIQYLLAALVLLIMAFTLLAGYVLKSQWRRNDRQLWELDAARLEIQEKNNSLKTLANYDPLTRLPNRPQFIDALEQAIGRGMRARQVVTLFFVDLDGFKKVNDARGHHDGDELLQTTARRLEDAVRNGDRVARLAGDEFAIVLAPERSLDKAVVSAKTVANKIINGLKSPYRLTSGDAYLSASVGVAMYPVDGDRADILLKRADNAMLYAKAMGKNQVQFFCKRIESQARRESFIENELREALKSGELEIYYQPQWSIGEQRYVAVEALLRWPHPSEGLISPIEFVPVAERVGLIHDVGRFVTARVCKHTRQWLELSIAPARARVNLSPLEFQRESLLDEFSDLTQRFDIPHRILELEITESVLMRDSERTLKALAALKQAGFRIAIDDFGTGYSSLAYLRRFPVDVLKIDRSFVSEIQRDESADALMELMLQMANKLGLEVVAEGVETKEQNTFLAKRGCDYAQGHLYSKPLSPPDTESLLRKQAKHRRTAGAHAQGERQLLTARPTYGESLPPLRHVGAER